MNNSISPDMYQDLRLRNHRILHDLVMHQMMEVSYNHGRRKNREYKAVLPDKIPSEAWRCVKASIFRCFI